MSPPTNIAEAHDRRVASPMRSELSRWMQGPAGTELLRMEVECVHAAVGNLFGYHCLQVGDLGGADLLAASRILGRTVVDIDGSAPPRPYPVVSGAATSLPIDSHAVDVLILPHVLEFESQPHEALREVSRVLVPEGNLVILGFNPLSVMGLQRALRHRAAVAPWCGTYFGAGRIRDWLTLLGFDIVDQRPCFSSKPGIHSRRAGGRSFVDWVPPALASARLILATKRVNAMLVMRSRWRPERRRLAGVGLAGPSVRAAGDE
ncbi:MAG: methyltransferase domain-containing protein [Thiotrichales bacterium]|nr:methyltransferase domain-containing protein [Thiotrichales bacterium]